MATSLRYTSLVLVPVALVLLAATPMIGAPDAYLITPGVGIGPIQIGMHIEQIVGILGTPKSTSGQGRTIVYRWYEPSAARKEGLSVRTAKDGVAVTVSAQNDARYHTANGMHPGSTEADVNAAFGVPSRVEKDAATGTETLWYHSEGIAFAINRNRSFRFYNQIFSIDVFRSGSSVTPGPTPRPGPPPGPTPPTGPGPGQRPIAEPGPEPGPNPILLP